MRWVTKCLVGVGGVLLAGGVATEHVRGAAPGAAGAAAGPPAIPGAAPAPAATSPGFFAKVCGGLDACRRKLCASPAGQMLNNAGKPLSAFSGGVIPSFCPAIPSPADLAQPGVAGSADAIKKDAAEAKMRREKVRFLGTVDCRYYPDATVALASALRTDGSECVRYEAALALSHGCCCNKLTLTALEACVSGQDRDGNPAERSDRVRCTAAVALERCLACYVPPPAEPEPPPVIEQKEKELESKETDSGPTPKKPTTDKAVPDKLPAPAALPPSALKKAIPPELRTPSAKAVEDARRTLAQFNALLATPHPAGPERTSVASLVRASTGTGSPVMVAQVAQPAPTVTPVAQSAPHPIYTRMPGSGVAVPVAPPAAMPAGGAPTAVSASARFAAAAPENTVAATVVRMVSGATPAERQEAIRQLEKYDWREDLLVATGLVAGAKNDPAQGVRIDCVRQLGARRVDHPQVVADLSALAAGDGDPVVRDEAAKALEQIRAKP